MYIQISSVLPIVCYECKYLVPMFNLSIAAMSRSLTSHNAYGSKAVHVGKDSLRHIQDLPQHCATFLNVKIKPDNILVHTSVTSHVPFLSVKY